jgi:hypothetical protein
MGIRKVDECKRLDSRRCQPRQHQHEAGKKRMNFHAHKLRPALVSTSKKASCAELADRAKFRALDGVSNAFSLSSTSTCFEQAGFLLEKTTKNPLRAL